MNCVEKFVKEENIKSYITFKDIENILKYWSDLDVPDYEFQVNYNESIEFREDYIYYLIENYNFKLAFEYEDIKKLLYYIYGCEFNIVINEQGELDLIDLQGVYLGGIDSYENFETIKDIIYRLSGNYLYDYFGIE